MRMMSWRITSINRGRPHPRRWVYVHFCATKVRYHRISHQRVRRHQRVELAERFAAQRMRSARESTAFGIGESNASTAVSLLQQSIFFLEAIDRFKLPTIDPAGIAAA
jgi:hypothetical protein